jgi:hypothetical protein
MIKNHPIHEKYKAITFDWLLGHKNNDKCPKIWYQL